MKYLTGTDIIRLQINWTQIINELEKVVICLKENDYEQPIKPYLRYGDQNNRFIAMPAYVGGEINTAGIKWIASFPKNTCCNKSRAHSVVIINDPTTGQPISIINTSLLSTIRTAGVSGLILKYYRNARPLKKLNVGIIGMGPIGKAHLNMCKDILQENLNAFYLYDLDASKMKSEIYNDRQIFLADRWQDVYKNVDILITATVSQKPYIDSSVEKRKGMLYLNVSLRDYKVEALNLQDIIIVDDWKEVCRENTDIERLHEIKGLQEKDTKTIIDVVCKQLFNQIDMEKSIQFHPMGMAVFDIALGNYYYNLSNQYQEGLELFEEEVNGKYNW